MRKDITFKNTVGTDNLIQNIFSKVPLIRFDKVEDEAIPMKVPDANIAANQAVSSNQLQDIAKTGAVQSSTAARTNKTETEGLGRADSVQISTLSSKINELQSGSPEREAYLERLAATYADGEYNADPDAIAARLVDNALEAEPSAKQQASQQNSSAASPGVDAYRKNI